TAEEGESDCVALQARRRQEHVRGAAALCELEPRPVERARGHDHRARRAERLDERVLALLEVDGESSNVGRPEAFSRGADETGAGRRGEAAERDRERITRGVPDEPLHTELRSFYEAVAREERLEKGQLAGWRRNALHAGALDGHLQVAPSTL